MAIEFTVVVDASRSDSALSDVITWSSMWSLDGDVTGSEYQGMVCDILPQSPLGASLIRDAFGISSKTKMVCQIDKFDSHQSGMMGLVELIVKALCGMRCDVVVLQNAEKGLLLRRNGDVLVDDRESRWLDELREALATHSISFTNTSLPSL